MIYKMDVSQMHFLFTSFKWRLSDSETFYDYVEFLSVEFHPHIHFSIVNNLS